MPQEQQSSDGLTRPDAPVSDISSTPTQQYQSEPGRVRVDPEITDELKRHQELSQKIEDARRDFLIVFGIFASFVTFLSVEIQIFKYINDFWLLIGLSAFLLASILLFALTLNNVSKNRTIWRDFISPPFVFVYFFIIVSFVCFALHFFKN